MRGNSDFASYVSLPKRIDIIWNHTRLCGYDCGACCVAAIVARGSTLFSADMQSSEPLQRRDGETKFAAAQRVLQERGEELAFGDKLRVIEHLTGFDVQVDVSGGDALIPNDGLSVLEACAEKLGPNRVTLTITGAGIGTHAIERVAPLIKEFNFTYDAASPADVDLRPKGYASGNLELARKMKRLGVTTRAECPLTKAVARPAHLERLYANLAEAGIDKLLLMRQFPVGRGQLLPEHVPTRAEYLRAIEAIRELECCTKGPRVKLQCALRHLEVVAGLASPSTENPCDLGSISYGLMADGTLLASPWAINAHGRPLGDAWVLGNLATEPLSAILATPKALQFIARADENHGHCKIFAALNSRRANPMDRIFDRTDPLYVGAAEPVRAAAE